MVYVFPFSQTIQLIKEEFFFAELNITINVYIKYQEL